MVLYDIAYLNI